jgi:hypothetical protein
MLRPNNETGTAMDEKPGSTLPGICEVSKIAQSILSELDRVRGTKLTLTLDIDAETAVAGRRRRAVHRMIGSAHARKPPAPSASASNLSYPRRAVCAYDDAHGRHAALRRGHLALAASCGPRRAQPSASVAPRSSSAGMPRRRTTGRRRSALRSRWAIAGWTCTAAVVGT